MSYTKNEVALETLISDINKLFYYVGEENDQIPFESLKQFEKYCVKFVNSISRLFIRTNNEFVIIDELSIAEIIEWKRWQSFPFIIVTL